MEYSITIREKEIIEAIDFWLFQKKHITSLVGASGKTKINLVYPRTESDDPRDGSPISAICEIAHFPKGESQCTSSRT